MTDTSPAAVERLAVKIAVECRGFKWSSIGAEGRAIALYAASQLEAANQRAEMLADSVAKAHAAGRAEGLREAMEAARMAEIGFHDSISGEWHLKDGAAVICSVRAEIEALIPADTPAKVTVQEASDTDLLDAIASNYWDLKCVPDHTGFDDADVNWVIVEHHQGKKGDVTIAHEYRDDPRAAIRRAIAGGRDE